MHRLVGGDGPALWLSCLPPFDLARAVASKRPQRGPSAPWRAPTHSLFGPQLFANVSAALARKRAAGVPTEIVSYQGMPHGEDKRERRSV